MPPVSLENLEDLFTYHPATPEQTIGYKAIRDSAKDLARLILQHCPSCADQQAALRQVREAVMTANAAIATRGVV